MEKNSLKWRICLLLMIIFCGLAGCAQEQPVQPVEISSFSEEYFNVTYPEDGKIELECTFAGNDSLVYGWYIYERFHKEEPVEKIKYSENPILQYTFPDPIKQYSIKCFVRDDQNDVQKSAWVPEESIKNNPANSLQDFNRLYVTVYEEEDNTYLLANNFTCPEEFQTGWYVYRAEDKTDPIYKKSYSLDSILSFTLPEEGTEYAVKAFVKNMETGEQKSAWVAYLPEEDWEEAADPIPEFTCEDIERTLLSGGGMASPIHLKAVWGNFASMSGLGKRRS